MNPIIFSFATILKTLVIFIGLAFFIRYLIKGIVGKNEAAKKLALKYFLLTFGIVIVLTALEFLFSYK